jgi:hypothetical protein
MSLHKVLTETELAERRLSGEILKDDEEGSELKIKPLE